MSVNSLLVDNKFNIHGDKVTTNEIILPDSSKGAVLVADGTSYDSFPVGTDGYVLVADSAFPKGIKWEIPTATTGDVDGPLTSTDNAIARFDGTSGKLIQNSTLFVSDNDSIYTTGCTATGADSVSFGSANTASGAQSQAHGLNATTTHDNCWIWSDGTVTSTSAANQYKVVADKIILNASVEEGSGTSATGTNSHAEGNGTSASNINCHAEGLNTTASNINCHAEGNGCTASGANAHAEGENTLANGDTAHAEGDQTIASGPRSHAQGLQCTASGNQSFASGYLCVASSSQSEAHGQNATTNFNNSYIWSDGTVASTTAPQQYQVFASNGIYFTGDVTANNFINLGGKTILTIATGVITPTKTYHVVDTEGGAATDDLDTITATTTGDLLILQTNSSARDVVVKHATGNIFCGVDRTLNSVADRIVLMCDGSNWHMISYADN